MGAHRVDRALLESYSTDEILRILKYEQDDYTDDAIAMFRDILDSRGMLPQESPRPAQSCQTVSGGGCGVPAVGELLIASPSDAVRVLNDVLEGVINGTISPDAGNAAAAIVTALLKALEQDFMSGYGEEESQ